MRRGSVAWASVKLRYSRCEPERVSVRAWYVFLSTYIRIDFNEVLLTFGTARTKRGKPSKPVIPSERPTESGALREEALLVPHLEFAFDVALRITCLDGLALIGLLLAACDRDLKFQL